MQSPDRDPVYDVAEVLGLAIFIRSNSRCEMTICVNVSIKKKPSSNWHERNFRVKYIFVDKFVYAQYGN